MRIERGMWDAGTSGTSAVLFIFVFLGCGFCVHFGRGFFSSPLLCRAWHLLFYSPAPERGSFIGILIDCTILVVERRWCWVPFVGTELGDYQYIVDVVSSLPNRGNVLVTVTRKALTGHQVDTRTLSWLAPWNETWAQLVWRHYWNINLSSPWSVLKWNRN